MGKKDCLLKIDKAELFIIKLPLISPFKSGIKEINEKLALIIKLSSEGLCGWGECVAETDPYYYYETINTASYTAKEFLIPILFSERNICFNKLQSIFTNIRGHNMAKSMVENALLDLLCKKNNVPLSELICGTKKKILSGISLGIEKNINSLLDKISNSIEKKYHRIKLKIKKNSDIKILQAVRKEFPTTPLSIDANGSYSLNDMELLKKFDEFELMMIEQPLNYNDLVEHSALQRRIKTPICLDESINDINSVKNAVNMKSCKIINIKQGRVGGILAAKNIHNYALKNNMKVWSGGMLETGIGRLFNIHLQSLSGFTLPGDTSETIRYFNEDIVKEPIILDKDGYINIPNNIGITVNKNNLEKFILSKEKFYNTRHTLVN